MEANFYIHGVLKGQEIWGSDEDRDYIKSFYSDYSEGIRFVVEEVTSKKRTFYTYLRGKNVYGSENRRGSYFGMTVSFEGVYCTDTESLFTLFDTIFNKRIIGSIIQQQNDTYRFVAASFESHKNELESIKSIFFTNLNSSFKKEDDFKDIDSSFIKSATSQVPKYNIGDIDNSNFFDVFRKTLKVYISPEYPTKDVQISKLKEQVDPEKAKNKRLTEEKADLEARLIKVIDKNKYNESELATLRKDIQKLEEDNRKNRNENDSLKCELERNKAKNNIKDTVSQIKQPLEELLRGIRKIAPSSSDEEPQCPLVYREYGWLPPRVRDIILAIILLSIIGLTFLFSIKFNKLTSSLQYNNTTQQEQMVPKIISGNEEIKLDIVISGIKDGDSVEAGKEYTANLENYSQYQTIKWRIDGADVPEDDKSKPTISVKPLSNKDTLYLTCIINEKDSIKKQWVIKK